MIIPEIIELANGIYHSSQNADKLNEGIERLNDVLTKQQPNETNRKKAEALLYRLNAKFFAVKYFDGGYLEEDYLALKENISALVEKAKEKEYAKTLELLENLLVVAQGVHGAMEGAEGEIYRVKDDEDNPTTADQAVLKSFADDFRKRAESLQSLPDTATLFGERVKIKDIKTTAINDLIYFAEWAENAIKQFEVKLSEQFFRENLTLLDDQPGLKFFDYSPAVLTKDKNTARTLVVLSPFNDEIVLFARAIEKELSVKFSIINACAFIDKSQDFIASVFKELSNRKANLIIEGLNQYNEQNKTELIKQAIIYSKNHGEIILIDNKGDRSIYDLAYDIVKNEQDLSTTDVMYKYLTMPNYNFVISELEERGMINAQEQAFVQENMAFMGFVGLNQACSLFVQGRPWKDEAIDISNRHERDCQAYLRRLPSQAQLIDVGWKKLELGHNVVQRKREFDYDSIRDVNVNNIKKILVSNTSLFAKCGLIVKYCVLAGEDVSSWVRVDRKQREERLNSATRLVAHLLNCEDDPEIKIVSKEEWEEKEYGSRFGGLCCDGGKRILYREDCCDNVSWLVGAVCHECYHSFQHTLQHHGWQEWHWTELGVTEYRVPEWDYNFERYKNTGTTYMIQVVESDARTFEKDCVMQSEKCWHLVDWE